MIANENPSDRAGGDEGEKAFNSSVQPDLKAVRQRNKRRDAMDLRLDLLCTVRPMVTAAARQFIEPLLDEARRRRLISNAVRRDLHLFLGGGK